MQQKNYITLTQDKSVDKFVVGVPVTITSSPQSPPHYFNQQLQPTNYLNIQSQTSPTSQNQPRPQPPFPTFHNQLPPPQPQPIKPNPQIIPRNQGQTFQYSNPRHVSCPACSSMVTTVVNNSFGASTYFWATAIFCCISPFCAFLPFVCDKCMDKSHHCPKCQHNILKKQRDFFDCT